MRKEYTNGEITVIWQSDKCIHSAICVKGLPGVFKPREQPWVKIDAASTDELRDQVSQCPSGALSYRMNAVAEVAEIHPLSMEIKVLPDGPILVEGNMTISHSNGSTEQRSSTTALCRCGASSNKPFCDGSHRTIDFRG